MLKKKTVLRFILGLKIRQLRIRRGMSLKELSDKAELSISYLNEIEKGKKYPKIEKLSSLAESLNIDLGELVSFKTGRNLHPLLKFLESDMIEKVPLELFGLSESDVVDLMGHAPDKFASFVLTVLQISRSFDMKMEDIYSASLGSYIESHNNYFPELERLALKMKNNWKLTGEVLQLKQIEEFLTNKFHYSIDYETLNQNGNLCETKFLVKRTAPFKIYLNNRLTNQQKIYYLAKELGHIALETSEELGRKNLTEMMDDFKTSYFAGALLIDEKKMAKDFEIFFKRDFFDPLFFINCLKKYNIAPDELFTRLTQILPSNFKVPQLFLLDVVTDANQASKFEIRNELHLSQLHAPHGVRMNETYCRRWVAIKSLVHLQQNLHLKEYVLAQISTAEDGQEYFSISLAYISNIKDNQLASLTIGFLVNKELKNVVNFLDDKNLKHISIAQTCERCPKTDCTDRIVPPLIYQKELLNSTRLKCIQELTK